METLSRILTLIVDRASDWVASGLVLKVALIACSIFATVQLLTLWATRYGDDNASAKSFFLSILLHCCFGLGWATVVHSKARPPFPPSVEELPEVRVTFRDSVDAAPELSADEKPVWNRTESQAPRIPTRIELQDKELTPVEKPVVEPSPAEKVIVADAAQLNSVPDNKPVPTTQQPVDEVVSRRPLPTAAIDSPQLSSRTASNSNPVGTRTERRPNPMADLGASPELQRGGSERISPLVEDGKMLTLPSDVAPDAPLPKPVGAITESIKRRSTSSPVPADVADVGSSATSIATKRPGDRQEGKFSRTGTRSSNEPSFDPNPSSSPSPTSTPSISGDEPLLSSRSTTMQEFPNSVPTPDFVRPNTAAVSSRPSTRTTEPYRARRIEQRRSIALKNGGTADSERAVEASLRWMADNQESDGRWSASRHGGGTAKKDPQGQDRLEGGLQADTGVTGLVVLSFLGAGYTHDEGPYEKTVLRAIDWLVAQQQANGYLGGKATRYDMMYCHAIATFALAEACGMQNDPVSKPELREAVRRGVRLISSMQNDDGGWRYGRGGESDMSMFGWQLMALKSAVNAGIPVPEETRRGMTKFLQSRALGSRGGLAGYKLGEKPTPPMTAEALFCRQMFNVRSSDAASQEAVTYLRRNLPRLAEYDEYYWYYGTLAMFQTDGEPWQEWNDSLRDTLIGLQRTKGPHAGSWDPNGKWAGIGGRLYSTALSTMTLEVYYRFLRIYQPTE